MEGAELKRVSDAQWAMLHTLHSHPSAESLLTKQNYGDVESNMALSECPQGLDSCTMKKDVDSFQWTEYTTAALSALLESGVQAVVDSPYPEYLPKVLELQPNAPILLTTRDSTDWAKHRVSDHGSSTYLCDQSKWAKLSGTNAFDLIGCASLVEKTSTAVVETQNMPQDKLAQAFTNYEDYVRATVKAENLMEFSMFNFPDTDEGHQQASDSLGATVKTKFSSWLDTLPPVDSES